MTINATNDKKLLLFMNQLITRTMAQRFLNNTITKQETFGKIVFMYLDRIFQVINMKMNVIHQQQTNKQNIYTSSTNFPQSS